MKIVISASLKKPTVIGQAHICQFGSAGLNSGSDGGFEPPMLSYYAVVKLVLSFFCLLGRILLSWLSYKIR